MLTEVIQRLRKKLPDGHEFIIVTTGACETLGFDVMIRRLEDDRILSKCSGWNLPDVVGVVIDRFVSKSHNCDLCGAALDESNDCTNEECERWMPF